MHIGILQTGHTPDELQGEFGDYDTVFAQLLDGYGFSFSAFAVVDMEFPKNVKTADGWLITGSRHGSYDDLPWIAPLEALIRDAMAAQVPLVGICFGHQIIAQALGGRVEKFAGGWAVGHQIYHFDGLGEVPVNAWHQDQVVELPQCAKVIARNAFCEYAALVYGDTALTIQPHPEFPPGFVEALARARGRGVVPDAVLDDAIGKTGLPIATEVMADQIAGFFKKPRQTHV